jgi:hypothetical protein
MASSFDAVVVEMVAALATAFNRQADEATFLAYTIGLEGLTVTQVRQAVGRALRTCKFMPSPAELREMAGEQSVEVRSTLAWVGVKDAIARHGAYRSVDFDDKAINAAIDAMGGWTFVCEANNVVLDRDLWPRFQKLYKAFASRGRLTAAQASPLLGIFARDNLAHGYEAPKAIAVDTGLGTALAIEAPKSATSIAYDAIGKIGLLE